MTLLNENSQPAFGREFFAVIALTLLIYGAIYLVPLLPADQTGTNYILIHLAATVFMLAVWKTKFVSTQALLIAGIIARILLFPSDPLTSNDAERYLWDGAVALNGFDPYTTPANDPAVAHLRGVWPTPIEHEQYATIYPPLAIGLFALSALAGPELAPWVWKFIATSAGIAALFLMKQILQAQNMSQHFALFALSPLLILETSIGLHLDTISVLMIVVALYAFYRQQHITLGAVLGASIAIKFLPAVLLGPIIIARRNNGALKILASAIVAVAIIYAVSVLIGHQPIGVVSVFFEKWRFGAPLFTMMDALLPPEFLLTSALSVAFVFLLVAAIAAWRGQLFFSMALAISTPLLVSPVVFPWYLMVLVPLIPLFPAATLIVWVCVAPLTYIVLNDWVANNNWAPAQWPIWAIAACLICAIVFDMFNNRPLARHGSNLST